MISNLEQKPVLQVGGVEYKRHKHLPDRKGVTKKEVQPV